MWHPTNEVWLPINKHPGYQISNLGRVRKKNKTYRRRANSTIPEYSYCKGRLTPDGYHRVSVHCQYLHVAHLVLDTFVGPRPAGMQCDHVNRIRDDNRMINLRWVTRLENQRNRVWSTEARAAIGRAAKNRSKNRVREKNGRFVKSSQDFHVSL